MRCPATLTGHSPFSVALPTVQKSFRCEFQWQTRAHTHTHTHTHVGGFTEMHARTKYTCL